MEGKEPELIEHPVVPVTTPAQSYNEAIGPQVDWDSLFEESEGEQERKGD